MGKRMKNSLKSIDKAQKMDYNYRMHIIDKMQHTD